ncbi:MAG: hypothetical protein QM783_15580 [Phycisphaerales bacterium]
MRFFRWRAWRAVPALDPLTPERAKAFVKTTKNLRNWRAARWWFTAFVFFPAMWLWIGAIWLTAHWAGRSGDDWLDGRGISKAMYVVMVVSFFIVPIVSCWVVHRWFVLQAVRSALTRRARCEKCGYTLTGLPLGDGDVVKCSECGRESVAERGLSEVREDGGRAVFDPPARSFKWQMSRKSVRKWGIRAAAAVVLVVVGLAGWWGWLEWTLRRDARLAAADRTGVTPLRQMWLDLQPAGSTPDDSNAWNEFQRSLALVTKANQSVWDKPPSHSDPYAQPPSPPDYGEVGEPFGTTALEWKAGVDLAEKMLPALQDGGVFEAWRTMRRAPRREENLSLPPGQVAAALLSPELKQLREVARMNKARMAVAMREGRREEFCDALATCTALAGMSAEYPSYYGGMVACVIDGIGFSQVRRVLFKHPSKEWLDGIEEAMRPDRPRPAPAYSFEADREAMLDSVAGVFAEAKWVKRMRWESVFGDKKEVKRAVGSYESNRTLLDEYLTSQVKRMGYERFERPPVVKIDTETAVMHLLMPSSEKAVNMMDQIELERRGLRVMIAIERYRLEHGSVPERLDQLAPGLLKSVPRDAWSGKPLCYRRLSKEEMAADRYRREYLLWSVGADGLDNNGNASAFGSEQYQILFSNQFVGFDFVINDPTS